MAEEKKKTPAHRALVPRKGLTHDWFDDSELRSCVQKHVRRGDCQRALYAANELVRSGEANRVMKALIEMAFEDIGYTEFLRIEKLLQLYGQYESALKSSKKKATEAWQVPDARRAIHQATMVLCDARAKTRIAALANMAAMSPSILHVVEEDDPCVPPEEHLQEALTIPQEERALFYARLLLFEGKRQELINTFRPYAESHQATAGFVRACLTFLATKFGKSGAWNLLFLTLVLYVIRQPRPLPFAFPVPEPPQPWDEEMFTPYSYLDKDAVLRVRRYFDVSPICLDKHTPRGKNPCVAGRPPKGSKSWTTLQNAMDEYKQHHVRQWLEPDLERSHLPKCVPPQNTTVEYFLDESSRVQPEAKIDNPYRQPARELYLDMERKAGTRKAKSRFYADQVLGNYVSHLRQRCSERQGASVVPFSPAPVPVPALPRMERKAPRGRKRTRSPEIEPPRARNLVLGLQRAPGMGLERAAEEEEEKSETPRPRLVGTARRAAFQRYMQEQMEEEERQEEKEAQVQEQSQGKEAQTEWAEDMPPLRVIVSSPIGQRRTTAAKYFVYIPAMPAPRLVFKGPYSARVASHDWQRLWNIILRSNVFRLLGVSNHVLTPEALLGERTQSVLNISTAARTPDAQTVRQFVQDEKGVYVVYPNLATTPPSEWKTKMVEDPSGVPHQAIERDSLGVQMLRVVLSEEAIADKWANENAGALFRVLIYAAALRCGDVNLNNVLVQMPASAARWRLVDFEENSTKSPDKLTGIWSVFSKAPSKDNQILLTRALSHPRNAAIVRETVHQLPSIENIAAELDYANMADLRARVGQLQMAFASV